MRLATCSIAAPGAQCRAWVAGRCLARRLVRWHGLPSPASLSHRRVTIAQVARRRDGVMAQAARTGVMRVGSTTRKTEGTFPWYPLPASRAPLPPPSAFELLSPGVALQMVVTHGDFRCFSACVSRLSPHQPLTQPAHTRARHTSVQAAQDLRVQTAEALCEHRRRGEKRQKGKEGKDRFQVIGVATAGQACDVPFTMQSPIYST